eukprot:4935566-Pleurochrysis_carterae.AAC.1
MFFTFRLTHPVWLLYVANNPTIYYLFCLLAYLSQRPSYPGSILVANLIYANLLLTNAARSVKEVQRAMMPFVAARKAAAQMWLDREVERAVERGKRVQERACERAGERVGVRRSAKEESESCARELKKCER